MLRWVIPNTLITKEHHTSCELALITNGHQYILADLALLTNGHHHCPSMLTDGNSVADFTLITNVHQHVVAAIELYFTIFLIYFRL